MSSSKKRVIIVAGGTAGHIFPARSTALSLSKKNFKVTIFADKNYIKYHRTNDSYNYKIINCSQLKSSFLSSLNAYLKIFFGVSKSLLLLLYYRPKVIISFGGYATFPALIGAVILRKQIILHEQNAHFGKVNRLFSKFAKIITLSYQKTFGIKTQYQAKTHYVGNPIREEIIKLSKNNYQLPNYKKRKPVNNLGYDLLLTSQFHNQNQENQGELFNILVIGGSAGAGIFSEILPKAFFNIRDELKRHISITQQCRPEYIEDTFIQYQNFNLNIFINSFFKNISEQIKKAHLIIARSGSSSIAEFTAAKKPLILIPFAAATDNHQEKNAAFIQKSGGAIMFKEKEFTISKVTNCLEKLIDNPTSLQKMSKASFACANLKAADNLVEIVQSLV